MFRRHARRHFSIISSPCLVATLWDVTDRDIDKFAQSVFAELSMTPDQLSRWTPASGIDAKTTSVVHAVAKSREACKLKYLTGAAPVIYGIPFYL